MIKFNKYHYAKRIINLNKLKTLSYDGIYSKKAEKKLQDITNAKKIILTKSATAALDAAIHIIDLNHNDEVIVPSFNYFSAANVVLLRNTKIIFADISIDDLNIDLRQLCKKISKKTRAIIVTHYAGYNKNIEKIKKICTQKKIFLIEDSSHCIGSKYKNKHFGTFGDFGVISFHESKNISSGDGGALIVNNKKFIDRAEIYIRNGTNKKKFLEKKIRRYQWISPGLNSKISELQSFILYNELFSIKKKNLSRKIIYKKYFTFFKRNNFSILNSFSEYDIDQTSNYHIFYIIFKRIIDKENFLNFMNKNKIQCYFHYASLNDTNFYIKNYKSSKTPVSNYVSKRIVRLPLTLDSKQQISKVIRYLNIFFSNYD